MERIKKNLYITLRIHRAAPLWGEANVASAVHWVHCPGALVLWCSVAQQLVSNQSCPKKLSQEVVLHGCRTALAHWIAVLFKLGVASDLRPTASFVSWPKVAMDRASDPSSQLLMKPLYAFAH